MRNTIVDSFRRITVIVQYSSIERLERKLEMKVQREG